MDGVERPLSPHLQIYRWQITNTLSILHRLTGLALTLGALVFAWWLIALSGGPEFYAGAERVFASGWFKLPLVGWTFCFFYHFANGIRHLFWDAGLGFEHAQYRASGWAVVVFSTITTLVFASLAIF
jgi:succinate dehydrogenase / fumarate reductase, cytochrome b subunit